MSNVFVADVYTCMCNWHTCTFCSLCDIFMKGVAFPKSSGQLTSLRGLATALIWWSGPQQTILQWPNCGLGNLLLPMYIHVHIGVLLCMSKNNMYMYDICIHSYYSVCNSMLVFLFKILAKFILLLNIVWSQILAMCIYYMYVYTVLTVEYPNTCAVRVSFMHVHCKCACT